MMIIIMKIIPTWPKASLPRFHRLFMVVLARDTMKSRLVKPRLTRSWPGKNYFHNISSLSSIEQFITFYIR